MISSTVMNTLDNKQAMYDLLCDVINPLGYESMKYYMISVRVFN